MRQPVEHMRQATKAELRLIAQRVSCMRRHGMDATVDAELSALGITICMPWETMPLPSGPRRGSPAGVALRRETSPDHDSISTLLSSSFPTSCESQLVDSLRKLPTHKPVLFLVAVAGGKLVGHVAFSCVECPNALHPTACLGPLTVHELYRRRGIGTSLILHGFDRCRQQGIGAVFVQGDVSYYSRFGFKLLKKAWPKLCSPWQMHKHDMGLELIPGTLSHACGTIVYPSQAWAPLLPGAFVDVPAALASIGTSDCDSEDAKGRTAARESAA